MRKAMAAIEIHPQRMSLVIGEPAAGPSLRGVRRWELECPPGDAIAAADGVRELAARARDHGAANVRAAATVRAFRATPRLAERIEERVGVAVELITAPEERTLLCTSLRSRFQETRGRLALIELDDLWTDVHVLDGDDELLRRSLPFGLVSLGRAFESQSGVLEEHDAARIAAAVESLSERLGREVRALAPDVVVVVSEAAPTVGNLAAELTPFGTPTGTVTMEGAYRLARFLSGIDPGSVAALDGARSGARHAALASVVIDALMHAFDAHVVRVTERSFAEGVLLKELAGAGAEAPAGWWGTLGGRLGSAQSARP